MMTKTPKWQIVDQHGDVIMDADDVAFQAKFYDTTPRQWAQRHAKDFDSDPHTSYAVKVQ